MTISFWSFALLFHMIGFSLIAGGMIGGITLHRAIWRNLADAPAQATTAARLGLHFPLMIQAGAMVMLLSGLGLLAARQWVYLGQPWLTVKLSLYVLLWLNGLLVARPASRQFERTMSKWLAAQAMLPPPAAPEGAAANYRAEIGAALAQIRRRLTLFHANQALMVAVVVIMAVFKFH
jgi:uncharacterized membrane protein